MIHFGLGLWLFTVVIVAVHGAALTNVIGMLSAIFIALWAIYHLLDERLPRNSD